MPFHSAILPGRLGIRNMLETARKLKLVFKIASKLRASVRDQHFWNTKESNPMCLKRIPRSLRVILVTVAHQSNNLEVAAMVHYIGEIDLLPKKVHLERIDADNSVGLISSRNGDFAMNSLTRMSCAVITNKFVLGISKHLYLDLGCA